MRLHAVIAAALLGSSIAADPCWTGKLGDLANLYDYPPAVSYCSTNSSPAKPAKRDAVAQTRRGSQGKPRAHGVGVCPARPPKVVVTTSTIASSGQSSSGRAAAFSGLLRESKPFISSFCSCLLQSDTIPAHSPYPTTKSTWTDWPVATTDRPYPTGGNETRTTTTISTTTASQITPTSTTSATTTTLTSGTTSSTDTTSATSTSTTTTTSSTTTTTTSTTSTTTTTTTGPPPQCPTADANVPRRDCQPGFCTRETLTCVLASTFAACTIACDVQPGCIAVNYYQDTSHCRLYADCDCPATNSCPSMPVTPVRRDCQPGFCDRPVINCLLTNNLQECQNACDDQPGCFAVDYNPEDDGCRLYGNCNCPDASSCPTQSVSPVRRDCQPGFCDRAVINCLLTNSVLECQNACDNEPGCFAVNYDPADDGCRLYGNCACPDINTCPPSTVAPLSRDCQPGFCPRASISCGLVNSIDECQTFCDNTPGCSGVNYNTNDDSCRTYGSCDCPPLECDTATSPTLPKQCATGACNRDTLRCTLTNSLGDCQNACDAQPGCVAASYFSNDQCVLYGDCTCA